MDYESISQRLRDMESRYRNGFSSLDRSFLDSLYFELYGKIITNTGCSDCYRDAYMQICIKLKRENKMPKKSDFQLKAGAVIMFFGDSKAYTNANLTNEVALRYISLNRDNEKMFSFLPSDLNERLEKFSKLGTNDNADKDDASADAKVAKLEAEVAELKVENSVAITECENLRVELSNANAALEEALAEIEKLKTPKSTRTRKSKEAVSSEANTTDSSAQSLDLED